MKTISNYIKVDLKRAFGYRFLLGIAFFIFLRWITINNEFIQVVLKSDSTLIYFSRFILNDMLLGVFAAFSLIPFGEAYTQDRKSGFTKYHIVKGDRTAYILSKLFVLFISSLVLVMVSYAVVFLAYSRLMPFMDINRSVYNAPFIIFSLEEINPLKLIVYLTLLRCVWITVLSMGSFILNLFLTNKFILYMGPSLLYAMNFNFGNLLKRKFGLLRINDIAYGMLNLETPEKSFYMSILILISIIVLFMCLAYYKMGKDVENE